MSKSTRTFIPVPLKPHKKIFVRHFLYVLIVDDIMVINYSNAEIDQTIIYFGNLFFGLICRYFKRVSDNAIYINFSFVVSLKAHIYGKLLILF